MLLSRISKQASSKFTPFFLMYNRYPRKAVTHALERIDEGEAEEEEEDEEEEEEENAEDIDAVLGRLLEIREKCHLKAKENICAAQQKQKRQYDKKHNSLKVSMHVMHSRITYLFRWYTYHDIF